MSGKRFKVDLIRFIRDSYQIRSIILEYNSLVSNRTIIWIVYREKYRSLKVWKLEKWASDNYVNQRESVVARVNLFGGGRYTCRIFILLLPSLFLLFYLDNNSEINSNQTYFIINRSTRQLYRSIDPRIVVLVHSSDYIRIDQEIPYFLFSFLNTQFR